jgi:hypothetical protein
MISRSSRMARSLLRSLFVCSLVASTVMVSACVGTDQTASDIQELGEPGCAVVGAADAALSGRVPDLFSPVTYNNPLCFKSYIVDLNNTSFNDDFTIVRWADANDETSCNNSVMWLQVYLKQGGAWVAQGGKQRSAGTWVTGGGLAFCDAPGFFVQQGPGGSSYRFATSARSGGASGPTKRFEVFTEGAIQ